MSNKFVLLIVCIPALSGGIGCRKASSFDNADGQDTVEKETATMSSDRAETDTVSNVGTSNRDTDTGSGIPSDDKDDTETKTSQPDTASDQVMDTDTCLPRFNADLLDSPLCEGPVSAETEDAACGSLLSADPALLLDRRWVLYAEGGVGEETFVELPDDRYLSLLLQEDDAFWLDAVTDYNFCRGPFHFDKTGDMYLANDQTPLKCSSVCCDDEVGRDLVGILEIVSSFEIRENCLWLYDDDKEQVAKYFNCSSYECIVASDCIERPWCDAVPGHYMCNNHVCYAVPEDGVTTLETCGDGECQPNESVQSCPNDCA